MSLVAHSSFRLSNSDEEILVVTDNIDDLFTMPSESKPPKKQKKPQQAKQLQIPSYAAQAAYDPRPAQSLIVTEELLRLVIDPITLEIMMDPVLAADNYTYDRDSITKWLSMKGAIPNPQGYVRLPKVPSPCTGKDLTNHALTANAVVKNLVELVVSSMQTQDKDGTIPLPEYHDDLLRDYLQRLDKVKRAQRTAANLKKLYGAHCCPHNHPLTLIRCGALPRDYQRTGRSLDSVQCSCCAHPLIATINWYFHCATCAAPTYDLCANCIANHRSHPGTPASALNSPTSAGTVSTGVFFGGRHSSVVASSSTLVTESASSAAATSTARTISAAETEAEADARFYNYPVKPMSQAQQQQQFLRRCFSLRVPPTATPDSVLTPPARSLIPSSSATTSTADVVETIAEAAKTELVSAPTVSLASNSRSQATISDALVAAIAAAVDSAVAAMPPTTSSRSSSEDNTPVKGPLRRSLTSVKSTNKLTRHGRSGRIFLPSTSSQHMTTTASSLNRQDDAFFYPIVAASASTGSAAASSTAENIEWPTDTLALMERETRQRRMQHQHSKRHQQVQRQQQMQRSHTSANVTSVITFPADRPAVFVPATNTDSFDVIMDSVASPPMVTGPVQMSSDVDVPSPSASIITAPLATSSFDHHLSGGDNLSSRQVSRRRSSHRMMRLTYVVSGIFSSFSPRNNTVSSTSSENTSAPGAIPSSTSTSTSAAGHHRIHRQSSQRSGHGNMRRFFSMNTVATSDSD